MKYHAGLMFSQFLFILAVASWCFLGFLVALFLLGAGEFSMAYIGQVSSQMIRDEVALTCLL